MLLFTLNNKINVSHREKSLKGVRTMYANLLAF